MPVKGPVSVETRSLDDRFLVIYNQEFRYTSWEGTQGYPVTGAGPGSGSQFYSPFALRMLARPNSEWSFEGLFRGGYVDAEQRTAGQSGSYSGFIDSIVSGRATYTGNPYFIPFIALSANLPTGESQLAASEVFARMDPDIVDVATFGEGFNIGPTIGFTLPFGRDRSLTLGAGYTSRGDYDRDNPAGTANISPSDIVTASALWRHKIGSFEYSADLSFAWENETVLNIPGISLTVDAGDRTTLGLGARYAWTPRWQTSARFAYTHISDNSGFNTFGPVGTPGVNANNDVYFASLEHRYGFDAFHVGLRGSYFKREENEYSVATLNFIPAKEKWQLTAFAAAPLSRNFFLDARVSRIWAEEEAAPGSGLPANSVDAWTVALGVNYVFN